MRVRFRVVKDVVVPIVDIGIRSLARLPFAFAKTAGWSLGLLLKSAYFIPASHLRNVSKDMAVLAGRNDPARLCFRTVDNLVRASLGFCQLSRNGAEAVADAMDFAPGSLEHCRRARDRYGAGILLVPHNAGAILAAAKFGREFPSVLLVKESKSLRRRRVIARYLDKLGPELVFVREADPKSIARALLDAFRKGKFVIGTTDLIRKRPDTVEVVVFGQRAWMPAWPARFARRRNVPLIPCYVRFTKNGRLRILCGEPYRVADVTEATQRWVARLEENILAFPEDWPFMFEKRWARLLAAAAQAARGEPGTKRAGSVHKPGARHENSRTASQDA